MADRLKLRAIDEEDLAVISAVLQDALVSVGDMEYLAEESCFVLVANRFCWEAKPIDEAHYERTLAGLAFSDISAVRLRGFDRRDPDRLLQILAIHHDGDAIVLDFSSGASLRLEAGQILCRMEDLCEAWPTPWRPRHPLDPG